MDSKLSWGLLIRKHGHFYALISRRLNGWNINEQCFTNMHSSISMIATKSPMTRKTVGYFSCFKEHCLHGIERLKAQPVVGFNLKQKLNWRSFRSLAQLEQFFKTCFELYGNIKYIYSDFGMVYIQFKVFSALSFPQHPRKSRVGFRK